jgi:hypothetical protein
VTSELQRRAVAALIADAERLGVPVPGAVHAIVCGTSNAGALMFAELNPDAEQAWCCEGDVEGGPADCTCWTPVYDVEQAPPKAFNAEQLEARPERCADCAFRPGSPELADPYMREELLALPARGEPFWCHDGMRRPVWWEHPTRGRVPGGPDDWRPPQRGRVPFRADGRPALLCAGWAAVAAKRAEAAS